MGRERCVGDGKANGGVVTSVVSKTFEVCLGDEMDIEMKVSSSLA